MSERRQVHMDHLIWKEAQVAFGAVLQAVFAGFCAELPVLHKNSHSGSPRSIGTITFIGRIAQNDADPTIADYWQLYHAFIWKYS